jgi:DNA polymerase elongation subunit (family B)
MLTYADVCRQQSDPQLRSILHHRQLAYKVSCNAIYGYMQLRMLTYADVCCADVC